MTTVRKTKEVVVSLLVFLLVVSVFLAIRLLSRHQETTNLKLKTILTTEQAALRLEELIRFRIDMVAKMRQLWRAHIMDDEDRFRKYATEMMTEFPGLLAINWIDGEGFIRWVVPEGPNKNAKNKDLKRHPTAKETFLRAMETGLPQVTPPIDLFQGGKGFAAYIPLDGAHGKSGYLNIVFRNAPLLEDSLHEDVLENFHYVVRFGPAPLCSDVEDTAHVTEDPMSASDEFLVGDLPWTLTLCPKESLHEAYNDLTDEVLLFFGVFLALLLAGLTWRYLVNQRRLAEKDARMTAMVANVPAAIYRCDNDKDWTMRYLSSEIESISGFEASEFIGNKVRSYASIIHEEDVSVVDGTVTSAIDSRGQFDITYRIITADGGVRWVQERGRAHHAADGRIEYLDGAIWDITDKRSADEEVRALRNYLSNIINSMPSVLVGLDADCRITEWNREAQRTTGVSPAEARGRPLLEVFPRMVTEMDRIKAAMSQREPMSHPRSPHQQEGETLFEDITIYPLVTNGVEGVVLRLDDVTDRVRIEEMMVQSEKMLSVGGLAAGMAHEINNPLAGMMQTAEVLCRRLTVDMPTNDRDAARAGTDMETIRRFMEYRGVPKMLDNIMSSGVRATKIVTDMLTFARQGDSTPSPCDLRELVDATVELARSDYDLKKSYDFKKILIEREYDDDIPLVMCEPSKIQQVLFNILRNGAESMQERRELNDDVDPRFILRVAKEQGDSVRVELEDNGTGMSEEVLRRAFEPFYTTKPTNCGTGLGLSVSYFIIVDNHGGELSVESDGETWTRFIIKLPHRRPLSTAPPGTMNTVSKPPNRTDDRRNV